MSAPLTGRHPSSDVSLDDLQPLWPQPLTIQGPQYQFDETEFYYDDYLGTKAMI